MSHTSDNNLLESFSNVPLRTHLVSPVTGEIVKRSAPTSLSRSRAIITQSMQDYYNSKPKPALDDDYYDEDEELVQSKDKPLFYVTSEEECKAKIESLLAFFEAKVSDDLGKSFKTFFIDRNDTSITYGEIVKGVKKPDGIMGISNDGVLRAIYELLRVRFASTFEEGTTIKDREWVLLPNIDNDIEVEITSNRQSDKDWMQDERLEIQAQRRRVTNF